MNILEISNIEKSFNNQQVLKGIDLAIAKGEVVTLIGSSGSGKSTLLRCINLLEQPDNGKVIFNNQNILQENININQYRSKVGMVFQHFNLFENMTCLQNCMLAPIKVLNLKPELAKQRAYQYLDKVGLSEFANSRVTSLSGGQKQRVAIARALCMESEVLLFDEPTSSLDPKVVGDILNIIKAIAQTGMTMVIVTHEMNFAREVSDRVVFMSDGQIEYAASANEMFTNPQNSKAHQFLKRVL